MNPSDTTPRSTARGGARRLPGLAAAVAALALAFTAAPAAADTAPQGAAPAADLPDGTEFYADPDSQVMDWVAANPNDWRRPVIADRIASQPQGVWFSAYRPATVTQDVRRVTGAADAAGEVPALVAYMLPNRDCGGASAGGAPDIASYNTWVDRFAAGLGDAPVIVILEPDSLALISCLDSGALADRNAALARAVGRIHAANPQARVYLDAGHSGWNPADVQAARLRAAGVAQADGIYTNVSNYRTTGDERAFAAAVLNRLGDPDLRAVVDTSRNGNGPAPGGQWCDPAGRAVGEDPTAATGDPLIDAYLWVKPPGEVDGCAGPAGTFSPDYAYGLATQ
ncbi:glycoside hydrolase family 6 protein [Nocardiopsis trehalosi]|uniref:glycoside hydrolase family 6 protein n=1 Tax=Nocardiopsis trehalosi TaxID=109329 RepID=UPI000AD5C3E0|nr:glycoside hydrolase family 6 protein [Nocardiopsis trehalosi]